jgi:hypothetical protein
MRFTIIIIIMCALNAIFGLKINKRLMQKIISSRIPVDRVKCCQKKTLGEAKIYLFNDYFNQTSKIYGNIPKSEDTNYNNSYISSPDEIVMNFRTMFIHKKEL